MLWKALRATKSIIKRAEDPELIKLMEEIVEDINKVNKQIKL